MKAKARFLGVDDAPFDFDQPHVRLVGVVTRGAGYVEGVLSTQCAVDGDDATQRIARMASGSRFASTIRCLFLNGVAVGGFNLVDLDALHAATGVPVVAVSRTEPDPQAMRDALAKHFDDWEDRWARVQTMRLEPLDNGRHRVWVSARGLAPEAVRDALTKATVRGANPECVRLAHLIAGGVETGESTGKA